jgi:hypothetical protein
MGMEQIDICACVTDMDSPCKNIFSWSKALHTTNLYLDDKNNFFSAC